MKLDGSGRQVTEVRNNEGVEDGALKTLLFLGLLLRYGDKSGVFEVFLDFSLLQRGARISSKVVGKVAAMLEAVTFCPIAFSSACA